MSTKNDKKLRYKLRMGLNAEASTPEEYDSSEETSDSDSDEDAQIEYDRYDDRVMTRIEHGCNTDMTAIAQ